ncbi:MAG TPA: hypothetical protein VGH33_01015 [Isosphaeraceae bacterium]
MKELEKPISRVFRRLRTQRFLAAFVWALAGWLAAATAVLAVDKFARPIPGPDWLPFAIAGGSALLTALLVAIFTGPSRVDAAVAIDRAFQLNERLSTTLTLPEELRETPAGRALVSDTVKHVADLDVADRFGLKMPRRVWAPLIPALLAGAVFLVPALSEKMVKAGTTSKSDEKIDPKIVSKKTEQLKERIAAQRKDMDKAKLAEADKLLAEVEKAANELAKAPPAEKDKALMALNKLTDAVKERQKALGSPDQVNRQLQQLQQMGKDGPAGEFMKDLAKGDFDKAAGDLKKLQEKLASGKMTEQEKKALKEQLGELSKQLKQAANMEQRKQQLEQARKNGGLSQKQFDQEMAKLDQQKKSLENVQKLANQLANTEKQMTAGDLKKAAEQLGLSQKQMEEMAQQMQEIQSLDSALAELQDAKDGMNGADMPNSFGDSLGQFGSNRRRNNGNGMGRGRGQGDRPEAEDDVRFYGTKTPSQLMKGKAVAEGFAPPSTQKKGQSLVSVQGEIETSSGSSADALTNQKVPKSVEKHVQGYFDLINKNK